jgi:uncharacterized alpha-E superfamily protein
MERAEDITRIITVMFNALLDMPERDAARAWRSVLSITGDEVAFDAQFEQTGAEQVMAWLLWHADNPNAVLTCMTLARENARAVRDQISSEMWEQINGLHYSLRDVNVDAVLRGPTPFFARVRDGSHAFQGVVHATMTHGEGFHFLQLGKHLERAEKTARIVKIRHAEIQAYEEGSPQQAIQLSAMLRACSAMEAFRKYSHTPHPAGVAEFLLLNKAFPRSAAFCMQSVEGSLRVITGEHESRARGEAPTLRAAGRINAQLEFVEPHDLLGEGLGVFIDGLLGQMNGLGDDIMRSFFSAQIVLPGWRSYAQQVQQQQQQQQAADCGAKQQ